MGDSSNGTRVIHRTRTEEGHEIRTVSLTVFLSVTLTLLGALGTVWGVGFGANQERAAMTGAVKEAVQEALDARQRALDESHARLDGKIDANTARIIAIDTRLQRHIENSSVR